jgi:hypothetical protein
MSAQIRGKKSTLTNSVKTMNELVLTIQPTTKLSEAELIHFHRVVNSRESSTWSENDRTIAGYLAKTYSNMDLLWEEVNRDGFTSETMKGTPVINPAVTALNTLTVQAKSYNTLLGISASQKGVSGTGQAKRNSAEIEARQVIKKASLDEDLLA